LRTLNFPIFFITVYCTTCLSFHWVRDSFTCHSESVLYASDNVVHSNLSENFSIFCDNVLLCMYVCISWHYTCHLTIAPTLSLQCTRGLLMFPEQCTCCYSRWGWSFPPGCPCGRTPQMVSRNLANSKSLISVHLSWSQLWRGNTTYVTSRFPVASCRPVVFARSPVVWVL
jgi:hypothetical protein